MGAKQGLRLRYVTVKFQNYGLLANAGNYSVVSSD